MVKAFFGLQQNYRTDCAAPFLKKFGRLSLRLSYDSRTLMVKPLHEIWTAI